MQPKKDQKIEIAHDILASEIYARLDQGAKMRLKINKFLLDRHEYYQNTGALLTKDDLEYIGPHTGKEAFGQDIETYIRKSKENIEEQIRKKRRRDVTIATILSTTTLAAVIALIFALAGISKLKKANLLIVDNYLQEIDSVYLYHLQYEAALNRIQLALTLRLKQDKIIRRLQEVAYFYNESGNSARAAAILQSFSDVLELPTVIDERDVDIIPVRSAIRAIDELHFEQLERQYFGELIEITGGEFLMGCRQSAGECPDSNALPAHKVEITAFRLGRTEVTNRQFALFEQHRSGSVKDLSPEWGLDGDNPVIGISWYDAARYTNWLNKHFQQDTVYVFEQQTDPENWKVRTREAVRGSFRLPTEAEWEFAARGGIRQENTIFSGSDIIDSVAWYQINTDVLGGRARSHPVGQLKPNTLGLYDMSGNAWEWCQDWFDAGYFDRAPEMNPLGPPAEQLMDRHKVLRGGCWFFPKEFCRLDDRSHNPPSFRKGTNFAGFRLAFK
ncbi:MAG: formylglycine-generating enzyme family protein [Saprospiraceae bacterium]|nr:formylglycine-generating enzyme family protein [Lewinella sp.]